MNFPRICADDEELDNYVLKNFRSKTSAKNNEKEEIEYQLSFKNNNPIPDNSIVIPNHYEKEDSTFPRLSKSVPSYESSVNDSLTGHSASFRIFSKDDDVTVFPHQLHAITIPLEIPPHIPSSVWDGPYDNMKEWGQLFNRYELMETKGSYSKMINKPKSAFGDVFNAIYPLKVFSKYIQLSNYKSDSAFNSVMQAITFICIQLYTMERNRWLRIKTDDDFKEAHPPYIFLMFLNYDVKQTPVELALDCDPILVAQKYDLTTLVNHVACSVNPANTDSIKKWVSSKLYNNMMMFLLTTRFSLVNVLEFDIKINESIQSIIETRDDSRWIVYTSLKYFPDPKTLSSLSCKIQRNTHVLKNTPTTGDVTSVKSERDLLVVRIPTLFSHFFLNPVDPILDFSNFEELRENGISDTYLRLNHTQMVNQCRFIDSIRIPLLKVLDDGLIDKINTSLNTIYTNWFTHLNEEDRPNKRQKKNKSEYGPILFDNDYKEQDHSVLIDSGNGVEVTVARDATGDRISSSRPTFYPEPASYGLNILRARYSYVLYKTRLYVNVVRKLNWDRLKPQSMDYDSSPLYMRYEVWDWLYNMNETKTIDKKLLSNMVIELDKNEEPSIPNPIILNINQNGDKKYYIDGDKYLIRSSSFEHYAIEHLVRVRNSFLNNEEMFISWELVYWGLIALIGDESRAVKTITDKFFKKNVKEAYTEVKKSFSNRNITLDILMNKMGNIKFFSSILVESIKLWDWTKPSVIRKDIWSQLFQPNAIIDLILRKYKLSLIKSDNGIGVYHKTTDTQQTRLMEIIKSAALITSKCDSNEPDMNFKVDEDMYNCWLEIKNTTENDDSVVISINELPSWMADRFRPSVLFISSIFHYVFPMAIVKNSEISLKSLELNTAVDKSPGIMDALYELSRSFKNPQIFAEVMKYRDEMITAMEEGRVFTLPVNIQCMCNLYLITITTLDIPKTGLLDQFQKALSQILQNDFAFDRQTETVLLESYHSLCNFILFNRNGIDEKIRNDIFPKLAEKTNPNEAPYLLIDLLKTVSCSDVRYKIPLEIYFQECKTIKPITTLNKEEEENWRKLNWARILIGKILNSNYTPRVSNIIMNGGSLKIGTKQLLLKASK